MRLLITGDRTWSNQLIVFKAIASYIPCSVIQGGAKGADTCAYWVCKELQIPCTTETAQWKEYGRAAGPIRNKKMILDYRPDMVLAFHNDIFHSRGTKSMVRFALQKDIRVILYSEKEPDGRVIYLNDLEYDKSDPNLFGGK